MKYRVLETPVGGLLLARDAAGLRLIHFQNGRNVERPDPGWEQRDDVFDDVGSPVRPHDHRLVKLFELSASRASTYTTSGSCSIRVL